MEITHVDAAGVRRGYAVRQEVTDEGKEPRLQRVADAAWALGSCGHSPLCRVGIKIVRISERNLKLIPIQAILNVIFCYSARNI